MASLSRRGMGQGLLLNAHAFPCSSPCGSSDGTLNIDLLNDTSSLQGNFAGSCLAISRLVKVCEIGFGPRAVMASLSGRALDCSPTNRERELG